MNPRFAGAQASPESHVGTHAVPVVHQFLGATIDNDASVERRWHIFQILSIVCGGLKATKAQKRSAPSEDHFKNRCSQIQRRIYNAGEGTTQATKIVPSAQALELSSIREWYHVDEHYHPRVNPQSLLGQ